MRLMRRSEVGLQEEGIGMQDTESESAWAKIQPEKNCFRYYAIAMDDDLFSPFRITMSWGRMGSRRLKQLVRVFDDRVSAELFYAKKVKERLRNGYVLQR